MKSNDIFLTTNQAAKRFRLQRNDDISALIRKNKFPNAIKTGKYWLIPLKDIKAYEHYLNKTVEYLDIKQAAKRLGFKEGRMPGLIKRSIFPNAFKRDGKWWIPKEDIEIIENEKMQTVNVQQACSKLDVTSTAKIRQLINKKNFPNAYKDFSGQWRIPHKDIRNYKDKQDDNSVDVKHAAQLLNYESKNAIIYLIKKNAFPNAYKISGKWRIPITDIDKRIKVLKNSLNTREVMRKLKYNHPYSIIQLIEKSILPNAFKDYGEWRIPLADLASMEKTSAETLDTNQVAKRLDKASNSLVAEMIKKGEFPNAFKDQLSKWRIPFKDIEDYEKENNTEHHFNVKDASNLLGYKSTSSIFTLLKNGKFPNAFKSKNKWWIPKKDIEILQSELKSKKRSLNKNTNNRNKSKIYNRLPPLKDDPKLVKYIGTTNIQKKLCLSRYEIERLFHKGVFSDILKYRGRWWTTKASFEKYFRTHLIEIKKIKNNKQNTLSVSEAAKRLGYASAAAISPLIIKYNRFPNAFKIGRHWFIPEKDIKHFEYERMKAKEKIEFTPKVAFSELENFIDTIKIPEKLSETKNLFLQYSLLQINNMRGSNAYKKGRVQLYMNLYKGLAKELSNEIFLVSTDEIEEMLHERSSFTKSQKKVLIPFLRYVYNKKDMDPDIEFSLVSANKRTNTQEIYSPDQFHKIYQYVKEVKLHIPHAVSNRYHANMWVYTILLLTDFIRGQDLIMHTPSINLNATKVKSLDWFLENELSDYEIQLIINQLYLHFRNKRTGKTDELLTFIIAPDLVESLAYALAISEMHRKTVKNEKLLGTFIEGIYSNVLTSGRIPHKNFFNFMQKSSNFKFSSLKMNRTVATYLFYSITEEDGGDSDLALHLSKVSRSHKKDDSTSRYIQSTNKDGSINRVAYNLFKRGHFGWLYNYLLLYVTQFENRQDTLEERSRLIEKVRKDVTPNHIENMGEFVHNSLNALDIKGNSSDMEAFMQNIYSKRQTVISKLRNYSKEETRKIIVNLAKGNLPSKNENAQCLVYPECKNPKLSSCFSCEYVIPGNLMLIQLNEELKRLISSIKDLTNEMLIKRDSMFLMHAMLIWKEARIAFGDEKVNVYIPMKETWEEIETIAGKLTIEL